MSIEVLLMADVEHLGIAGDTVHVKDGYARNFLFPQNLAEPVTKNSLRKLEKIRKEREELNRIRKAEAEAKAKKLRGLDLVLTVKTVDEIRLYGSISAADLVSAIAEKGVDLDRAQIQLDEPIKEVGAYDIAIALMPEVVETVKLTIVAE